MDKQKIWESNPYCLIPKSIQSFQDISLLCVHGLHKFIWFIQIVFEPRLWEGHNNGYGVGFAFWESHRIRGRQIYNRRRKLGLRVRSWLSWWLPSVHTSLSGHATPSTKTGSASPLPWNLGCPLWFVLAYNIQWSSVPRLSDTWRLPFSVFWSPELLWKEVPLPFWKVRLGHPPDTSATAAEVPNMGWSLWVFPS